MMTEDAVTWECPLCGHEHSEGVIIEGIARSIFEERDCEGCNALLEVEFSRVATIDVSNRRVIYGPEYREKEEGQDE